jgi:DNA polymerase III subunit gamma/tau
VPDSIKKKYGEQSRAASVSLLLSWLNIANHCDINYKGSKNQRLSVELAMMKMAHVNSVFKAPKSPAFADATVGKQVLSPDTNGTASTPEAVKKKLS